jgi:hypothetical protein
MTFTALINPCLQVSLSLRRLLTSDPSDLRRSLGYRDGGEFSKTEGFQESAIHPAPKGTGFLASEDKPSMKYLLELFKVYLAHRLG